MQKEYAMYKGDKLIAIGTRKELAELRGVTEETIYFYSTNIYANRGKKGESNRTVVIPLDDE